MRATVHGTIRCYESTRDRIASIENKSGAMSVSKFEKTVDALGQCTSAAPIAVFPNKRK